MGVIEIKRCLMAAKKREVTLSFEASFCWCVLDRGGVLLLFHYLVAVAEKYSASAVVLSINYRRVSGGDPEDMGARASVC